MRLLLLAGAILFALMSPVYAQSCPTMDDALAAVTSDNSPHVVIDEPDAVKAILETLVAAGVISVPGGVVVTRVLLATLGQHNAFGLEVGGCITNPMLWPAGVPFPLGVPNG